MRALGPIMRGHIRTNYKNTTGVKLSVGGTDTDNAWQVWKNAVAVWGEGTPKKVSNWPEWIIDRVFYHVPLVVDAVDAVLDLPRSLFANIYSRKLPQWGNVNEKIKWVDLEKPTLANILALNAFAHHDIITLPLGINQTVTTETLDVVEDVTSRIPKLGGLFNNLIFGKLWV